MVKTYAILEDSVIVNVLVCDESLVGSLFSGAEDITSISPQPQIGYTKQEDGSYKCRMESMSVPDLQALKYTEFDEATKAYILDHYDIERQSSLQLIRNDARWDSLTNRYNYVTQAVTWINSILEYHFGKLSEIEAATTVEELIAIDWDLSQFDATDPVVWISTAMSIAD